MSNRNTDSLLDLAEATQRHAPVLKRYLPPCGLAVRFDTGAVITASGIAINTVMEANAAQRVLYRFLRQYPGKTPRIVAAAAVGAAGENACALADLLTLAAFSDAESVFTYRRTDGGIETLRDLPRRFTHRPRAAARMRGAEAGGYTLRLEGIGTTQGGRTIRLDDWVYPDFRLLAVPDPTDLTPVRAMMADLYEDFAEWQVDALHLTGGSNDFPLSGRDLQVLRRALPETTPVLWNDRGETLASLMPGAYQSNYTRTPSTDTAFWQDVPEAVLIERLGEEVFRRTVRQVVAFARTAPVQPPRVAGVILEDGRVVTASHVPLHGLNVPSCAEAHALRRALSQEGGPSIRALVLLMHENHTDTPLLGIEAAPCGFCRTCITAVCDPSVPVILTDGQGRFQWALAGTLLKYHRRMPQRDVAVAAAETAGGDCLSITTLHTGQPDCDYPPAIGPELAYRGEDSAVRLLLHTPDPDRVEQLGAYARHWLAKAAGKTAREIVFDGPTGTIAETLEIEDLFGALPGFDFAGNQQFVDGPALHFQHHAVIPGEDMGR